jgi:hypothetical protein
MTNSQWPHSLRGVCEGRCKTNRDTMGSLDVLPQNATADRLRQGGVVK